MRLSSELELHIPTDVTQIPQYKLGDRFYSSTTLEPELPLRSNLAIIINTQILTSKPLLVLYQFNRWGLYATNGDDLYNIGNSETYYRSSVRPLMVHELTVPRLNPLGLNFIPVPLPAFNQNKKNLIMNSTSPVEGSIVRGPHQAVEMERSEVGRPRPFLRIQSTTPLSMNFDGDSSSESPRTGSPQPIRRGTISGRSPSPQRSTLESTDQLTQLSYETLVKQLYGLPVTLPDSLIVNDLRLEFIPFSQLSTIQIERYIIEPLLQPWAGPPSTQNRILTIFGKNGMTYLVKALYNASTNRIFPPV